MPNDQQDQPQKSSETQNQGGDQAQAKNDSESNDQGKQAQSSGPSQSNQQSDDSGDDGKGGKIANEALGELQGKIHADEQRKLAHESDEYFDTLFYGHLVAKLKPEMEAFNKKADFADELAMSTGGGMLQFTRDNKPAYALMVKHRVLHFFDPGSSTPVTSLRIAGGPDEFVFHGGKGHAAPIEEQDALKGFIRLAAGGKFQAE